MASQDKLDVHYFPTHDPHVQVWTHQEGSHNSWACLPGYLAVTERPEV